ncbi:hypothetical protein CDEN61S_00162 [Castellaniella denitrificans]
MAGGRRAGEGHRAHAGMRDQRLAGRGAVAVDDVEHPRRHAGLQGQPPQVVHGQGRQFAHLHDGRIAERQAGRELPGRRHEGHVPGRDQGADPDRLPHRDVQVAGVRGIAFPVQPLDLLGEEMEIVGRARHQRLAGLADDLACVPGFQAGQLGHVARDQLAQAMQDGRALGGRPGRPDRKGLLGGLHGPGDLVGAAAGDLGQDLARRGIQGFEDVGAFDFAPGDQMLDHGRFIPGWRVGKGGPRRPRWC